MKVVLPYIDFEDNYSKENVWVEFLGDNQYKIDNIPFFAQGLSYKDIISVKEVDEQLVFDELIKPSGHSTIQIIFFKEVDVKRVLEKLSSISCTWEGMNDLYFAIDIAHNINYSIVKEILDEEEFVNKTLCYCEASLSEKHFKEIE